MKLVWTRLSLADLESARLYVADHSPEAAARTIRRIKEAAAALGRQPELGRKGRVEGTREWVVSGTPFILVYRLNQSRIEVVTVLHASRLWPDQL